MTSRDADTSLAVEALASHGWMRPDMDDLKARLSHGRAVVAPTEALRSIAQRVHQAYHAEGTIESCLAPVCEDFRKLLPEGGRKA